MVPAAVALAADVLAAAEAEEEAAVAVDSLAEQPPIGATT